MALCDFFIDEHEKEYKNYSINFIFILVVMWLSTLKITTFFSQERDLQNYGKVECVLA